MHAATGVGTAMVAMPPLVLVLGVAQATPLVGLAALFTVVVVLARHWQALDRGSAARLLVASLPGIPCGVLLLHWLPGALLQDALGILLCTYGLLQVWRVRLPRTLPRGADWWFGFVAGVLGGAYNTNGPPVVVYGLMAGWSPARFRATLSGYFLPAAVLICASHALGGLWTPAVFAASTSALPALVAGNLCGAWLARHVDGARFSRLLHGLIAMAGLLLLA